MTRKGKVGLVIAALLIASAAALWVRKPWMPPVQLADPGPSGRRVTQSGLLGNYYPASSGVPSVGILLLGGSEGGLGSGGTAQGRALQAAGFSVLHLSYFRGPGQSRTLENAPLELFDRALAWLSEQPGVDPSRLAVIGGSKGAEAALLIATRHPELKAVVAAMPSSVVWPGVDWEYGFGSGSGSSWSEGGEPLDHVPYGDFDYKVGIRSRYDGGLAHASRHPGAIIPIERAGSPILLICGESDSLWPSCPMARQVLARAAKRGGPEVKVLAYRDAGHAVFGTPVPKGDPKRERLGSTGGSSAGNAAAREDAWPKVVNFLRQATLPLAGAQENS
jgi:dienelactone hydrolase